MKYVTTLAIMLLASVAGLTQDKPAASPVAITFGDARVTVPAGWRHVETQAGSAKDKVLLIVPQDNTEKRKLAILLLPSQDLHGADLRQTFDAILKKGIAANERLIEYSELPTRQDAAGYDFLTRAMVVADNAGHRNVRVCFGANPRGRLEMLMVSADSKETLKRYEADIALLLRSYSFSDASSPVDKKNDPGSATGAPAGTDSSMAGMHSSSSPTNAKVERDPPTNPRNAPPVTQSRVPEGTSVLLCNDAARLDFAMDAAKDGRSSDALRALRHDAFFRVNGPASLEVRESELKSRWPKVFVKVLDGDSAGRTGWVLLSELTNAKQPTR